MFGINEMGLLGFLGIVVDGNNLGGVRNDFTDSAGAVGFSPSWLAAINSHCIAKRLDRTLSWLFVGGISVIFFAAVVVLH